MRRQMRVRGSSRPRLRMLISFSSTSISTSCSSAMTLTCLYTLFHPFPLVNQGELAALYCFVFLFISAKGSGIWSVDHARG